MTVSRLRAAVGPPLRRVAMLLWRRCLPRTTIIGVTGSNGKTTVTKVLASILEVSAPTVRTVRNTERGVTQALLSCRPWRTRFAVVEMAAGGTTHTLRLARHFLRPDVAVVLSIFLEHRSLFKTLEGVAKEKAKLVSALRPGGLAVLNGDDPHVRAMPVPGGVERLTFGRGEGLDARFGDVESAWPNTLRFTVTIDGRRQPIVTRMLGAHWAGSITACVAIAHRLGMPLDRIAGELEGATAYPGRMQPVPLPSGAIAIRDELKCSEHTVTAAFEELRRARATRKFIVFGDLSDTSLSPRKRLRRVGRWAADIADHVLFVGDNAMHGAEGAGRAGLGADRVAALQDYREAHAYLAPLLGPGDVVLFKADWNRHLSRLFYALVGEVRCEYRRCGHKFVCDFCPKLRNPALVDLVNDELARFPLVRIAR